MADGRREEDPDDEEKKEYEEYLKSDGGKPNRLLSQAIAHAGKEPIRNSATPQLSPPNETQPFPPSHSSGSSNVPRLPFKHQNLGAPDPVLPSFGSALSGRSSFVPKTEEQLAVERAVLSLRLVNDKKSSEERFSRFRKDEKFGCGERGDGKWSDDLMELLTWFEEGRKFSGGKGINILGASRMDVPTIKQFFDECRDYIPYDKSHNCDPDHLGIEEHEAYIRGGYKLKRGARHQILVVESLQLNRGTISLTEQDIPAHISVYDLHQWAPETTRASGIPLPLVDAFEVPFTAGKCTYYSVKDFII